MRRRVLEALNALGLADDVAAARMGVDARLLARSLYGYRRFTSVELALVSELTQVPVRDLLGEPPPPGFVDGDARLEEILGRPGMEAVRRRVEQVRQDMHAVDPAPWVPEPPDGAGVVLTDAHSKVGRVWFRLDSRAFDDVNQTDCEQRWYSWEHGLGPERWVDLVGYVDKVFRLELVAQRTVEVHE